GTAPTDGYDRWLAHVVMDCRAYCVQKSLVRVGRKIDSNSRFRHKGADYLDVEHDLAIGAVWIANGSIYGAVNGNSRHAGTWPYSELCEVGAQVGAAISAAQLDDGDRLSRSGRRRRVVVQLGDGDWRIGGIARRLWPNASDQTPKVRPRLWALIQPKHTNQYLCEIAGYVK